MLEVLKAESGSPVARWEGLSLASTRHPEKEAHKWVDQMRSAVECADHIIVLGLGCGYHVFELARQFPDKGIFVFEACNELVDFCEKNFSLQMARIEVIVLNSPQQMSTSARVQKALSQAYAVLEHKPSLQPRRGYYKELAAILRGRERAVFREYLELRPQRKNLFDEKIILSEIMKDENSNQLLSIKNIESWLKDEERWSKSGSLIQVLRELVK